MLVTDDFPELGTNLVTTLAALDVDNLTHVCCCVETIESPASQAAVRHALASMMKSVSVAEAVAACSW